MADSNTKIAIVTGGARGIGRGCALALAEKGFDLALVDLLAPELARTKAEIEALGRRCLTFEADVADHSRAKAIAAQVVKDWGRIDFLLNNAGKSMPKPIVEITEDEFDRTIAINLKSCFNYIQAVAPTMLGAGRRADRQHVVAQRLYRRRDQRGQQVCLCRGQGRNPGHDARPGQGAGADHRHQCDLPGRDQDRARQQPDPGARTRAEEGHRAGSAGHAAGRGPARGVPREHPNPTSSPARISSSTASSG